MRVFIDPNTAHCADTKVPVAQKTVERGGKLGTPRGWDRGVDRDICRGLSRHMVKADDAGLFQRDQLADILRRRAEGQPLHLCRDLAEVVGIVGGYLTMADPIDQLRIAPAPDLGQGPSAVLSAAPHGDVITDAHVLADFVGGEGGFGRVGEEVGAGAGGVAQNLIGE